jgi:glycosyltransferase involved in cell wall biosynthesis
VPEAPVLITAFNRPELTKNLIKSLKQSQPKNIIFAVDGPRSDRPSDAERVKQTQDLVSEFNWNCELETIFRPINLGLRVAVADAVSHATSKYGKVIVVEDDIEVGPNFLGYMQNSLIRYVSESNIAHINGYVVVPTGMLQFPNADRKTRYVESFAWATWEPAWKRYDASLTWAKEVSVTELSEVIGSLIGALRWKQHFFDASRELIDTWAYRWLATIWSQRWFAISPPVNLVRYRGWLEGTHTKRKARWTEEPVSERLNSGDVWSPSDDSIRDERVDDWIGKNVFGESARGVCEGFATSLILRYLRSREPK